MFEIFNLFSRFSQNAQGELWRTFSPGIRDHLRKFWTKFQLDSSYFRIKAKFGKIALDYMLLIS